MAPGAFVRYSQMPVFAFVLLDLVYYAQHRLEHAVPLLWAIHCVHHQSRDHNLSVSFRARALAPASTAFFGGMLLVFERLFGTFAAYSGAARLGIVGEKAPNNPLAANLAPWAYLAERVQKQLTIARKARALFMRLTDGASRDPSLRRRFRQKDKDASSKASC